MELQGEPLPAGNGHIRQLHRRRRWNLDRRRTESTHNVFDEAPTVQVNRRLARLHLVSNKLGADGGLAIADALRVSSLDVSTPTTHVQVNCRLQRLSIGHNELGKVATSAIAEALKAALPPHRAPTDCLASGKRHPHATQHRRQPNYRGFNVRNRRLAAGPPARAPEVALISVRSGMWSASLC